MTRPKTKLPAYIHHVVKNDKRRPTTLLLVADTYLADAAIPSEQIVQVFPSDLVIQIFDKEDPVCTRREFRLQ